MVHSSYFEVNRFENGYNKAHPPDTADLRFTLLFPVASRDNIITQDMLIVNGIFRIYENYSHFLIAAISGCAISRRVASNGVPELSNARSQVER